jgi:hypothetical protein
MSLSRPEPKRKRYIGRDKVRMNIIKMNELHWTEQLAMKPKDTRIREPRETGDFDNRNDNWDDPENYEK